MHCIYTIILIKHINLSKRSTRNPLAEGIHKETLRKKRFHYRQLSYFKKAYNLCSAAYKYYFCAGHHEQKNQKTTVQIKFSAATLNYQIKRLNDIPYVNKCQCFGSSVAVAQFHLYFLSSQITVYYCFCLKRITLCICLCSSSPSRFCASHIRNIGELGAKKYSVDLQILQFSYLFIIIRNFLGLIFFRTSRSEGKFPRRYLINIATCLFADY